MSDVCNPPPSKHRLDAHNWMAAFAVVMVGVSIVFSHEIISLRDNLGVSGLAYLKLDGDMATLRQEIAALRQTADRAKAGLAERKGADASSDETAPLREQPRGPRRP
jgi:hypothetical protein